MGRKTTLILGVGNLLLGDEGVGVHVAQQLLQMPLPGSVEVVDGGTLGFELLPYLEGRERVFIVDALLADAEAGSLLRFDEGDADWQWQQAYSVHQGGLRDLLAAAKRLLSPPQIVIFGIVPHEINHLAIGLSQKVYRQMPVILSTLLQALRE